MQIIRAAGSDTIKGGREKEQPVLKHAGGGEKTGKDQNNEAYNKEDRSSKVYGGLRKENGLFGLSVDIGTTTVVMELYDLSLGKRLAGLQEKNRQTLLGADVMMRLMHCQRGSQEKLEQLIREQLQDMAEELCNGLCAPDQLKTLTVVGNTTMCHILLGQDISGLAGSPFHPAYRGIYRCKGSDISLNRMPQLDVIVPAGIDAHVGADAAAMICDLQLQDTEETVLAVDIGTNAEIALSCHGELSVCSAPAGPAFEGAQISQGMRGEPGAIAGMHIARQSGNILLEVIPDDRGNLYPVKGICGSGLIDSIASLRQCGILMADGYLLSAGKEIEQTGFPGYLKERITEKGFILYLDPQGRHVYLTQKDIRQFQLAKAAVQAGVRMLLEQKGLTLEQVDRFYIAGVFGGHISKKSAVVTGLFPDISQEKLVIAGNAAGAGAAKALLSESFLKETEVIGRKAEHMELAGEDTFQQEFLASMEIAPWK